MARQAGGDSRNGRRSPARREAAREQEARGVLAPVYDPRDLESRWYRFWEQGGYLRGDPDRGPRPFCIVIPPPNVTGSLHMGHALNTTLQDILVRFRRMQGFSTLWLPGTDHAGIATQVVVEAELAGEGKSRHDLGREAFLERVWRWKEKYGGIITHQLRRLGASCDWSRERFTMDPGCSRAVREVFVRLFDRGLIYRGDYIINWCPRCQTALSDLEVEHEETEGRLWYLRYPLEEGSDEVRVATTRPETMLGDTAVAVHPEDERYRALVGRHALLPLVGRRLPIVADAAVDPAFGTGAVKVTPAHDPADFEIGRRHGLPAVKVIGEEGRMTPEATGAFAGLTREQARVRVLEALRQQGFLVKEEPHRHAVGHCQRCGTVVEPLVSQQWFVRMKPLAEPAVAAVREGRIRFVPERFASHYFHWMENVRDWCISRQLWWGHRIPVWYCADCGQASASTQDLERCPRCGSGRIEQDPDVLDTWFSSALWPFSTLGWPESTRELRFYYPTSVLVTGFDIIFFWVARMIVMGLEFMGDVPFRDVLVHGLVRDEQGRKMSKSKGTGVDPLEMIEGYGADALRFTLVSGVGIGNDVRWHPARVESSRNFANKLWNAARFALMRLEGAGVEVPAAAELEPSALLRLPELSVADRWILSRLQAVTGEATRLLERYDLGEAARVLYGFAWDELCDWYIEMAKPRLADGAPPSARQGTGRVLWHVLETTVRLLHPFIPFVTEAIWQRLVGPAGAGRAGGSIMVAPWPAERPELRDADAEAAMGELIAAVRTIRNVRAEKGVPVGRPVSAIVWAQDPVRELLEAHREDIRRLAGVGPMRLERPGPVRPSGAIPAVASASVEVFLPLADLLDVGQELRRLTRELEAVERQIDRWGAMLQRDEFVSKAPADVVEATRRKKEQAEATRQRLVAQMEQLKQLVS